MQWFNELLVKILDRKSEKQDQQKYALGKAEEFAKEKYWEEMLELRDAINVCLETKAVHENLNEELGDFLFCTLLDPIRRARLEDRLNFDFERMNNYLKRDEVAIQLFEMNMPGASYHVQDYKYTSEGWKQKGLGV